MSASRVGAAFGLSRYQTPRQLAHEMLNGDAPVDPYKQAILDRGSREEPTIRAIFRRVIERRGGYVFEPLGIFRHGVFLATPDGFVDDGRGNITIAELKRSEQYNTAPDPSYLLQVWLQCEVTGATGGYLFYASPSNGWTMWTLDVTKIPASTRQEWRMRLHEFMATLDVIDKGPVVRRTGLEVRRAEFVASLTSFGALRHAGTYVGQLYDGADGTIFMP